jgi:putative transposase
MDWKQLLAYITGSVDEELVLRNEYLVTENRLLRQQLTGRVHLTDAERKSLAEIGKKLGKKALYVLFLIHVGSRQVHVAGVTLHPHAQWMMQVARHVTIAEWGFLAPGHYLIHDRDGKFCPAFQQIIDEAGVTRIPLPPRSPNLNAYAERWVRSVKDEALSRMILFGERSPWYTLQQYADHYHTERPHQGKGNVILIPATRSSLRDGPLHCRQRLGGLLKYYHRDAA